MLSRVKAHLINSGLSAANKKKMKIPREGSGSGSVPRDSSPSLASFSLESPRACACILR